MYLKGLHTQDQRLLQASTTSFYVLISLASYTVFGQTIEEDILKNINPAAMQSLLGPMQVGSGFGNLENTVQLSERIQLLTKGG